MAKRFNPKLAKIHRSYTVEEAAEAQKVHKKTVRNWIRNGLPVYDEKRPLLILGTDLRLFLQQQKNGKKRQCKEGEVYCLKCRAPRKTKPETAKFIQPENGTGRMFARCRECDSKVNRFFSWRQLEEIQKEFEVESAESTKTHICEGLSSPKLPLA